MWKKRRVPEVLWRIFRHRACTLAETFESLLPPADCRCEKRLCLRCRGAEPGGLLLRPDDPLDYRELLNQCYVVFSETAPPHPDPFTNESHWTQRQMVVRAIEMTMSTQSVNSNLICSGYDMYTQSSPIVDLLSCPTWDLLLTRVRDDMMFYLLMNTSIFLPLSHKRHQQVAGPPINTKLSKNSAGGPNQHSLSGKHGLQKRKRDDDQLSGSFSDPCPPFHTGYFSGCTWHQKNKQFQLGSSNGNSQSISISTPTVGNNSNGKSEKSSKFVTELGKRSRPFRWQREKKRRLLDPGNNCIPIPCTSMYSGDNTLHGKAPSQLSAQSCHSHKWLGSLLSQARKNIEEVYINRKFMFYNLDCSANLLRRNIICSLKPNFAGSEKLARVIFSSYDANKNTPSTLFFCSSGSCPFGSKCLCAFLKGDFGSRCHSLIKSLKVLIRRSHNCQYDRLMDKHCGAPSLDQISSGNSSFMFECHRSVDIGIGEDTRGSHVKQSKNYVDVIDPQYAAKLYCPKSQVVSFIWAVCRSIVPADMLGTCSNWRILRRNISKFIKLRKFENFSLKQAMHKMKTSWFPFLSNELTLCCQNDRVSNSMTQRKVMHEGLGIPKEAACMMKQNLMKRWIYWLFQHLIVPLIQAHFYVTETEFGKQDVYFFRKSIWEKLTNGAIASFKDKVYRNLNDSDVRDIIASRTFGFSKLRLCPKENGVRILANLKACSRMPTEKFHFKDGKSRGVYRKGKCTKFDSYKPVNYVLRDTHAVLKGIKLKEPELLGASVFDYNDVYQKLRTFLLGLKKAKTSMPDLFLVVSDVSNAFDSVDQDKLLDMMRNIIVKDEYQLKHCHQILCTKKTLWAHENVTLTDRNISPRFSSPQFRSLHTVYVNQESSSFIKKEKLFSILKEHVKKNVLQFDKRFYLQKTGISQGSVLSSLLCSLYFGDMERKLILPFLGKVIKSTANNLSAAQNCLDTSICRDSNEDEMIINPDYMLLRFIDDFLFISTSKQLATHFLTRLQRGFREYNCYMNERKYGLNFDDGKTSGVVSKRVYVGKDGVSFLQWSGLLINCQSLGIQADYTKYLNNHLNSTLTVCWHDGPGRHLREKLCGYLRPKCHLIFFDLNINTAAVIRLNIFQAFLLCAMKFHCYICHLSDMYKYDRTFLLDIIRESLRYMNTLVKDKMSSIQLDSLPPPSHNLEDGEVEWLGLKAYIQVLTRKQTRHTALLSLLKSRLSAHESSVSVSSDLIYAVDRSHSSLLWQIKY